MRHWIRGNDQDAASLASPLAFKMEILRLLRMSPTTPVLPPVGGDDASSDSTSSGKFCLDVMWHAADESDHHATVPGHERQSGSSLKRVNVGQTSVDGAPTQDGQCFKEMPPASSQYIKDTTWAAPLSAQVAAESPFDTIVTPSPEHVYIDHDHDHDQTQHVIEPATSQDVANGSMVHTATATHDVSSNTTHDDSQTQQPLSEEQLCSDDTSLYQPESAEEPGQGTNAGSRPFRSSPLSTGLMPLGSTHAACDGMQHNRNSPISAGPQPGAAQAEYAFDQSCHFDLPHQQDEPAESTPVGGLDSLMLHPHIENLFGASPGSAICSHLEDALGEGLDSWYESVEGAVTEPTAMEASPSMIDWDVWLNRSGA